jgi:hypothetical protein
MGDGQWAMEMGDGRDGRWAMGDGDRAVAVPLLLLRSSCSSCSSLYLVLEHFVQHTHNAKEEWGLVMLHL